MTEFWGYRRPDGSVGVRNHVAIIPSVYCANHVARRISEQVAGTISISHQVGCSQVGADFELTAVTLGNVGCNANIAGVLVVGLGCEKFRASELAERIARSGKPVEVISIQDLGGTPQAIEQGTCIAQAMVQGFSTQRQQKIDASALIVGLKCGGTDATSGIAANPAVGIASDKLISCGATAVFCELTELYGTEELLARRACDERVAAEIRGAIADMERNVSILTGDETYASRRELLAAGNIEGGVTTIVEKALGGMCKAGNARLQGVLDYGSAPPGKGLYLMKTKGHDSESVTGLIAGGAQIVLFTTGRGSPAGSAVSPVIKITGNPRTFERMVANMDINAGTVMEGTESLESVGSRIFDEVLAVASGKRTKAELLGHTELFSIPRVGAYGMVV